MKSYVNAEFFEEIAPEGLKTFFTTLLILPFALLFKAAKTIFRIVGVLLGLVALVPTLGREANRNFFVNRVSFLAKDLADWVLFPFTLARCLVRSLLSPFRKESV